jgi:hypothetical protein
MGDVALTVVRKMDEKTTEGPISNLQKS